MLDLLVSNLSTIVVSLIILAVAVRIILKQIRAKQNGKSACSACSGCAAASICPSQKETLDKDKQLITD